MTLTSMPTSENFKPKANLSIPRDWDNSDISTGDWLVQSVRHKRVLIRITLANLLGEVKKTNLERLLIH